MECAETRALVPALNEFVYVDMAARNPLCKRVRDAVEAYLDDRERAEDNKSLWFDKVEEVRGKVATLISANPAEIAFMKNTSHGLNAVLAAMDWREGDNVVIAPDFEHPNNVYAWLNLRRLGVEVRVARLEGPVVTRRLLEGLTGPRTRAIGLASVSFATGGKADLEDICSLARDSGARVIVDAVQSLGVMDFDVSRVRIDAAAAATSKALLGLYGLGVLYCRRELADSLHPSYLARFSVDLGDAHEEVLGDLSYSLAAGARRFDIGNYNYLAIFALDAALDLILEVGVKNIEEHVTSLSAALTRGIRDLGYVLRSADGGPGLSHIVLFVTPDGYPPVPKISAYLSSRKIRHTVRRGALRMSFHMYNNMSDVEYILAALKDARSLAHLLPDPLPRHT